MGTVRGKILIKERAGEMLTKQEEGENRKHQHKDSRELKGNETELKQH